MGSEHAEPDDDLERQVAWALETEPALLPVMPALLADLDALGSSADDVIEALGDAGLPPGAQVLDLGCGKGAIAVALAGALDAHVEGVDGLAAFVEEARARAQALGVGSRCTFRHGDMRALLGTTAHYDAVLLLAVGPVLGDHRRTIAGLRTLARRGGVIVIDDAFLSPGAPPPAGYEAYGGHDEVVEALTSFGDEIVAEIVYDPTETAAQNARDAALFRARAEQVKAAHPDLAAAIDAWVAAQEQWATIDDVVGALWVIRRT